MVLCLVFLVLAGNGFWCFVHMVLIEQYSCVVVSVFGSSGKLVSVLHTYVLRVQYNCGGVLVFWSVREIVIDFAYVFSVQYSCGVVNIIGKIRPEKKVQLSGRVGICVKIRTLRMIRKNYDRKKGTVVLLTRFATHVTFYFYYVCT